MAATGIIVPGEGNPKARWAIVGEAPGEEEAHRRRPFVGRTGQAQDAHLERNGLDRRDGWLTNLMKEYRQGNPYPEPEDVAKWGPVLLAELRKIKPKFIITAGALSTRFFLGESAYLEAIHGIPHRWSDGAGYDATILPCYHPASPFYNQDLLPLVTWDYARAAAAIKGKLPVDPPIDLHPKPQYFDLDDSNFDWYLGGMEEGAAGGAVGLDTEGVPGSEWSVQVSVAPGTGLVLRKGHPRFSRAIALLREKLEKKKPVLVVHPALYDFEMCLGLGLDFLYDIEVDIFDTMMAAYLLCVEPQSLKNLARRHCGMVMKDYAETVGQAGLEKQLGYLERVMEGKWGKPEARVEHENDGSAHLYTPQPVQRRAEAILVDYYSEKLDKEGRRTDPHKRWKKVDRELRVIVEKDLGAFPIGTLADIPLADAVYYAGRDPDANLRLYPKMKAAISAAGLDSLMTMKMRMLPAAVSMKINGITGDRASFEKLGEEMTEKMGLIRDGISRNYFQGRPFNPASSDQVATLMRRRGLRGEKKTSTGKMSTSKKSIEHLRFEDEAIEQIEQWREHQKVRDSFVDPVLENWPEKLASTRVVCDLKITRVSSGRFSATAFDDRPSAPLLAIPVRNELGKSVRDCYRAEEGYELFEADLDQAEMRVMADESRDERLVRLFNDGKIDIHTDTASKIFGVPYDQVHKMKHRYPSKRAGFGVITGIQDQGLLDQLRMAGCEGWDLNGVAKLRKEWFKLYPGVQTYMTGCHEECRRAGGVIKDRWGMQRYLPAIFSEDKWERWEAQRQTHSHKIQGGAQGMLQRTMGWLWEQLWDYGKAVRFIVQIHDSLMFEILEGLGEDVAPIILRGMTDVTKLRVPVKSSGSFAQSWGKLKD